jgi:hypothetical protein
MEQMPFEGMDSDSESDLSELSDGSLSDDSEDSDDSSFDFQLMSQAEQAEHESFGDDYEGPVLSDNDSSRLLVLMAHASTCPCKHKLTKHRDVCKSTKFMMLHVRDCPGTTASFDVCPFPWCRKVKHLLYHLVSCVDPESCGICSPNDLSDSLKGLVGLNEYRLKKHRHRLIAATKAASSVKTKGAPAPNTRPIAQRQPSRKASDIAKAAALKAKSSPSPKHETKATKMAPVIQPLQTPAASPATAVHTPAVEPAVKLADIAKQPESQNDEAKSSDETTTMQSHLTPSAAEVEIAEMATSVKTEPEPEQETFPTVAVLEAPQPSVETPPLLQQDLSPAASTATAPESTTVEHAAQGQPKEEPMTVAEIEVPAASAEAPTGAPKDPDMSVAPEPQPEERNMSNDTSVTSVVDHTGVKMETEEEAVPGTSETAESLATAIETAISVAIDIANETTAPSTVEPNAAAAAAAESEPTMDEGGEDDQAPTPASNPVQLVPTPAAPATTTPEAESLAIKEEEPGRADEQLGEASSSAQTCKCPPGEDKWFVENNESSSDAIAIDREPAKSDESSSMETEDPPPSEEENTISGPIQTQASSEALEIACQ